MMKSKFLTWGRMLFALCAMLAVISCSDSDDKNSDNTGGNGGNGGPQPVIPTNGMATVAFQGIVQPDGWGILPGVTVTSGDQTTKTDFNGMYKLDKVSVVNGRAVVKFQKDGYMTVVRSVPCEGATRLDVSMSSCSQQEFSSATSSELKFGDYQEPMTVQLPADGFVTESGAAYTGVVKAKSVYLDPDGANFSKEMPGDLTALRTDNSEAQLVSYGMVAVDLTDGAGNKLNLAPGKTATLTFPIPDKFKDSNLPATIPLWSFNETSGMWEEEGVATLNSDRKAYVGTVTHFSWHNLDQPELRATLKIKVVDNNGGVVSGVQVNVDGQRTVSTGSDGMATCTVPSNTSMTVWVPSEAYGNYAVTLDENGYFSFDEKKIVTQKNVVVAPQETKTITLTMPVKVPVIKGKVTNEGSGTKMCVLWVSYGMGNETDHVFSDYEGNFSILAPATYRGPATLVAQYGDGYKVQQAIKITDDDQVVNLTANTSSQQTPGVLMVLGNGLNLRYAMPAASDPCWNAVNVSPRGLNMNVYLNRQDQGEWGNVNLYIPDYVEGTTTYTSSENSFHYMMEGVGGWTQIETEGELTVNVTKSGDTYNFKISNANARLVDRTLGMDWDTAASVKISVEFSAKEGKNEY